MYGQKELFFLSLFFFQPTYLKYIVIVLSTKLSRHPKIRRRTNIKIDDDKWKNKPNKMIGKKRKCYPRRNKLEFSSLFRSHAVAVVCWNGACAAVRVACIVENAHRTGQHKLGLGFCKKLRKVEEKLLSISRQSKIGMFQENLHCFQLLIFDNVTITVHWGFGIGSTDTEAVSLSEQEGVSVSVRVSLTV